MTCKANFTSSHFNIFFPDLIDDWSSKAAPDIYSFVPYNFTLSLVIKQFELLTLANENNWVDTSSQHQENGRISEHITSMLVILLLFLFFLCVYMLSESSLNMVRRYFENKYCFWQNVRKCTDVIYLNPYFDSL